MTIYHQLLLFLIINLKNRNIEPTLYIQRRPSFVSQGHYEIDRATFKIWAFVK
jgi:hypothetical protein